MANNTILNTMTGGDTIQTFDNTTYKTQAIAVVDSTGANAATVKAASTAIASTDKPLAVGLHPTSPLPAGTNIIGALTANQSVNTAQYGGTAVVTGGVAGTVAIGGVTAASVTATGNPVRIGAIARTTNPTAVTDGQVSNVMTDKIGRVVVVQGAIRNLVAFQQTTIASTTTTAISVTGAAGTFLDATSLTITNPNASMISVTVYTGVGSVFQILDIPANSVVIQNFSPPIPQASAATGWTISTGTTSTIRVTLVWVVNI
jgi:hypothetical protein